MARIYRTGLALAAAGLLAWYKWLRGENPPRGNQQLWAFIVLACGVSAGILLCDAGSFLANFVHGGGPVHDGRTAAGALLVCAAAMLASMMVAQVIMPAEDAP